MEPNDSVVPNSITAAVGAPFGVTLPPTAADEASTAPGSPVCAAGAVGSVTHIAKPLVVMCLPAARFWPPACWSAVQVSGFAVPSATAPGGVAPVVLG